SNIDIAPRTAPHPSRNSPNQRVANDDRRIAETIEEIPPLEVFAERADDLPICSVGRRDQRVHALGDSRNVIETEHRAPRLNRLALFHELACDGRAGLQMHHGDAVDHREDAALASEDAVRDLVAVRLMERRSDEVETAAAV